MTQPLEPLRVLVLGASGGVGRELLRQGLDRGFHRYPRHDQPLA
jgi:hypothetical protein